MDEPPAVTPDEQPRPGRLTRRRLALIVLLPLAVIAGGSGVYLASRGGLLVVPPRATAPPGMTPSPLAGPSGPLATAAVSSQPSGAASGPTETSVLPTLVPPG